MTAEVTAEEYLLFVVDIETHKQEVDTVKNDWRETTRARCIQDAKFDLRDNLIDVGNQDSDEQILEVFLHQQKPVEV